MTYNLREYGHMIADKARLDPYAFALKAAVHPDSVVLDIGAGPGIMSMLACKFGARRVYAVEPNDIIHLAREVTQEAGFGERVHFIQDLSTRIDLPEKANVIVSDLRGILPLFGQHIPSIVDARQRHLVPSGILIPQKDALWCALVEAPNLYKDIVSPWDQPYGLPMEQAKRLALNSWTHEGTENLRPANLLTHPQLWTELDYRSISSPDVSRSDMRFTIRRAGKAHGWLVWFESQLSKEAGFSCGPENRNGPTLYGRGFFPLLEPLSVESGIEVVLSLQAELTGLDYAWRWRTNFETGQEPDRLVASFYQATDIDGPLSPSAVAGRIAHDGPSLPEEARIDQLVLGLIDGQTPYQTLAERVRSSFPGQFQSEVEALDYIYKLVRQYDAA